MPMHTSNKNMIEYISYSTHMEKHLLFSINNYKCVNVVRIKYST